MHKLCEQLKTSWVTGSDSQAWNKLISTTTCNTDQTSPYVTLEALCGVHKRVQRVKMRVESISQTGNLSNKPRFRPWGPILNQLWAYEIGCMHWPLSILSWVRVILRQNKLKARGQKSKLSTWLKRWAGELLKKPKY